MLCFILGTRPEIIKLAPIIRRAVASRVPFRLIHTGQHYDDVMDGVFFRELSLSQPDFSLKVGSCKTPAQMLSSIIAGCAPFLHDSHATMAVVQGDTNSVLGGALAAQACGIPVAHIEAGLRSYDRAMPEETNRILVDHLAARLYAPTAHQMTILRSEGIPPDHLLETGNTILDAVTEHRTMAAQTPLPADLSALVQKRFALMTLHRPALVDDPAILESLLNRVSAAAVDPEIPVLFLAHPRTKRTLERIGRTFPFVIIHDPLPYLAMLRLLSAAAVILTDSGGLQEEAAILHVPCITLRTTTERPETIAAGGNVLVSPYDGDIAAPLRRFLDEQVVWKPLYVHTSPSDTIFSDLCAHAL